MYDCSKITRLTIMYTSEGPGKYAGEKRKILGPEESRSICEEANSRNISIEMLLKSRESIESVVINTVLPFPSSAPEEKPEEQAGEKKEEAQGEEKKMEQPPTQNV